MVRKFTLRDKSGSLLYNLNSPTGIIFYEEKNICVTANDIYSSGNHVFTKVKEQDSISAITGTLIFIKGFSAYYDFIGTTGRNNPCRLDISRGSSSTLYCFVDVNITDVTNVGSAGEIMASVSFRQLSPWYGTGTTFTKTVTALYDYGYLSSVITANNYGDIPAPFKLSVVSKEGVGFEARADLFYKTSSTSSEDGEKRITYLNNYSGTSVPTKLFINTTEGSEAIGSIDGYNNLYSYLDLTKDTFFQIPANVGDYYVRIKVYSYNSNTLTITYENPSWFREA